MTEINELKTKEALLEFLPVIKEAFQTVSDEFGFTPENNAGNAAFMTEKSLSALLDKSLCYGLFCEGVPSGFFALESGGNDVWYLEKLSVHPSRRHEGWGRKLMDKAFLEASVLKAKEISIGIINENSVLKKWYEDYGFRETGLKNFPHLPFTVCFMKKPVL